MNERLTIPLNHAPRDTAPVEADPARGDPLYDEFYKSGGWQYSFWKEYWWHRRHFVKRFGLRRGMRILEIACGNGFHTHLFNRMGFECFGVDRSAQGIAWARSRYPRWTYYCCDIMGKLPVDHESFDVVFARGCSHYHYHLMTDQAMSTTGRMLQYLRTGGVYVMVIVTDLSGRREPDKIWHNTLEDYRQHFAAFGLRCTVDWASGLAICGLYKAPTRP